VTLRSAAIERRLVSRVGSVTGAPRPLAAGMAAKARDRMGALEFFARAFAFLLATHPSVRVPEAVRVRAVGGLVTAIVAMPGDLLEYLGYEGGQGACRGLLEP